jgi:hypothetical protein
MSNAQWGMPNAQWECPMGMLNAQWQLPTSEQARSWAALGIEH